METSAKVEIPTIECCSASISTNHSNTDFNSDSNSSNVSTSRIEGTVFDVDPNYDNRSELLLLLGDSNVDEEKEDEEEDESKAGSLVGYWLEGDSLAPPCQADMKVVDSIISFANLKESSKLIDLGCGDGRICIRASLLHNCMAWGCEIEEHLVAKFNRNIKSLRLTNRVFCINGDLCEIDYSLYNVIVIYLLPEAIELIKQKLHDALLNNEDTVLVCNTWGPKGWKPIERINCGKFKNVSLIKYDKRSLPSI